MFRAETSHPTYFNVLYQIMLNQSCLDSLGLRLLYFAFYQGGFLYRTSILKQKSVSVNISSERVWCVEVIPKYCIAHPYCA